MSDGGDPPTPPDGVAADLPADTLWTTSVTTTGAALILSGSDGWPILRILCARDLAVIAIDAETFAQIGSEERLSFGIDREPVVFVADVVTPRPVGVHADVPVEAGLLARLEAADQISAVYGAQVIGPHRAPERQMLLDFTAACRGAAGLASPAFRTPAR